MNPLWRQLQPGKHPHKPFLFPLAHHLSPMYPDAIRQVTLNGLSRTLLSCYIWHSVLMSFTVFYCVRLGIFNDAR